MVSVLQGIIDRWHAAHPDWPRPADSTVAGTGDDRQYQTAGEAKNLVLSSATVEPVRSGRNSLVARMRQGATRLGIAYQTYKRHAEQGERWCSGHRGWHPIDAFHQREGYHRITSCVAWRRERERQRYSSRRAAS
jgi:hypothetical protein